MLDHINNFFKNNRKLLISISIYLLIIFLYYKLVLHKYFIVSNDSIYQYNLFYEEWIRIIVNFLKTGKFNTYSYNMFLGTDFFSSMGYYCTGDVFLPILLLFRNNIRLGLLIETIIRIYISGLSMSVLLKEIKIKNDYIVLFISLLYAVAGQTMWMIQDHMFHRFYSFLPLLFYSTHYYFNHSKKTLFIIIVALLFMQSYYFMYPTLIFLFLFCLFELIYQKKNTKYIVNSFFDLLFGILVGFAISAVICLPSIMYALNIVGEREPFNSFVSWLPNTKIGIVLSYIVMTPFNAFPSIYNSSFDYNAECFNIFVTVVPLVLSIYYLTKKKNIPYLILMVILQFICFIKPLNSIMHGFSTPSLRWLFLLEFYVLYISAKSLSECNILKNKGILIIIFGIIFFIYIVLYIFLIYYRYSEISNYKIHITFISISLIVEFIIFLIFIHKQNIGYLLSIIFVLASTLVIFSYSSSDDVLYIKTIDKHELNNVIDDDEPLFRFYYSYIDSYDGLPLDMNSSLVNQIPSTASYNTMYESKIDNFIDLSKSRMMLDWIIEVNDPCALKMLGVKYYISKDNHLEDKKPSLKYIGELKNFAPPVLYIYENNDYIGFGYTKNKIKYTRDFNSNQDFVNYIMIDDESFNVKKYNSISDNQLTIKEVDGNHIEGEITLDSDNVLFLPIPNNKGWEIEVNDNPATPISVNGGFIGIALNKGKNVITMDFKSPYIIEGIILSCLGIIVLLIVSIYEKRTVKREF